MWYVSPYKWLIEGVVGQGRPYSRNGKPFVLTSIIAVGKNQITCSELEYVKLEPPSGSTCLQYLEGFISKAGGYVLNEDATSGCQYCSFRTTDEFLSTSFTIAYSHHWRNLGIVIAFTVINVCGCSALPFIVVDTSPFVDRSSVCFDVPLPDSHLEPP
jgi:ATP-binding cassette subfamily G (WHITE) protein 2 (SNQ2)